MISRLAISAESAVSGTATGLFAVGVLPLLESLFKSVILGAIVVVFSVINAAIAIPIGIVFARRLWRTQTKGRRIAAGALLVLGVFALLWVTEVVVVALLIDSFLVH
jgi:hypothetical protein